MKAVQLRRRLRRQAMTYSAARKRCLAVGNVVFITRCNGAAALAASKRAPVHLASIRAAHRTDQYNQKAHNELFENVRIPGRMKSNSDAKTGHTPTTMPGCRRRTPAQLRCCCCHRTSDAVAHIGRLLTRIETA